MVKGMDQFREHFRGLEDRYVLIGGAACDLLMEEAGLDFRATKDLDIVLCVEVLDAAFVRAFWEFVKKGGYKNQQKSTGKKLFYRFKEPQEESFPWMLELFSRVPDALNLVDESHLTPIPAAEELSSLSAILPDEDYYSFIHGSKRLIQGLMAVTPECLVPLKARAWLDLTGRKATGEGIDDKTIKKHKNDVFRLFQLLSSGTQVKLPGSISDDLSRFLKAVEVDPPDTLKPFGLRAMSVADMVEKLRSIYGLIG
ncbi:MAG: hypothetical protein AB9866_24805 [Syntrophobacteraceae bacterium]